MLKCRVAKKIKKYTHYLNYENYNQSVLSKLNSGSFAFGKFADVRLSLHVKEFTNFNAMY